HLRVSLDLGRRDDVYLDFGPDLVDVARVRQPCRRWRGELLEDVLALAVLQRLLLLRELLADALGGIELERRLLLFWFLFFPLDRDVGLRRLLLDLGLR